jgi:hypothetical protein
MRTPALLTGIVARLRFRLRDETGSLPMVMLLTTVALGVSVVLTGVVASEQTSTRVAARRDAALNAAQSGLDVAIANIRAAVRSSDGSGDPDKLPCLPIAGTTSGDARSAYTATVYYLASSPPSGNVAWALTNQLGCTVGSGPANLPAYAMIVSIGRAGTTTTTRTVTATYAFTSTVQNGHIPGGIMKNYDINGVNNLCLTAGPPPYLNPQLAVETCNTSKPGQQFTYQNGLTISLKNYNLCADGRTGVGNPTEKAGNKVTLQTCAPDLIPNQQWSQNDDAAFVGTDNGTTLNDFCWNIVANKIYLADRDTSATTCEDLWSNAKSFFPAAEVGTGRAGAATGQLVNSKQFGRCIDVTANDVTWGFLVIFPCKQSVTGVVLWNQTWKLPPIPAGDDSATGYIYTISSGTKYCLGSPGTTSTADRGDGSPASTIVLKSCTGTGTPPANLAWTVYSDTGRPTTSFRIESTYNAGFARCLAAADPNGPAIAQWETYNDSFGKLLLGTCSGADLQKWNTISLFYESSLTDITEP